MKSKIHAEGAAVLVALFLLASCSIVGTKPGSAVAPQPVVQHLGVSGDYTYSVDLGPTPRDLYFVFTNTDLKTSATKPSVGNIVINGVELPGPEPAALADPTGPPVTAMDKIRAFVKSPKSLTRSSVLPNELGPLPAPRADTAGVTTGNYDVAYVALPVPATCQAVVGPITTDQGPRTLNIWVANDCWAPSGKLHGVTLAMVNALADKFLLAGASNDIFDWDTAILGPEWGNTGYSELIPFNSEVTILLADIEGDNSDNGGIVGYFDATNNFKNTIYSNSNQRIMFVIDAVMFANPDDNGYGFGTTGYSANGWLATDYWAEEVFSTLAHEFQHMIHFYQKGILARGDGQSADTWIDEMCAQLMEDFVADKQGVMGPRGLKVADAGSAGNGNGRIPSFNFLMSLGLTVVWPTPFVLEDYSTAYSFGAYLARNYGGAPLLRAIVHDPATDSACITDAVSAVVGRPVTMSELLEKWAVSVLASERSDLPPGYRYNVGTWFSSSAGGESYNLGSINFFNYAPVPKVITSLGNLPPSGSFNRASSLYFRATPSAGASGNQNYTLFVPDGVAFSTYVTP